MPGTAQVTAGCETMYLRKNCGQLAQSNSAAQGGAPRGAQADDRNLFPARRNSLAQQWHGLAVCGREEARGGKQEATAFAIHVWNSSRKLDAPIALQ